MLYWSDIRCHICEKGFTSTQWDRRHSHHQSDCDGIYCSCDYEYHEKCCPKCHPKRAERILLENTYLEAR